MSVRIGTNHDLGSAASQGAALRARLESERKAASTRRQLDRDAGEKRDAPIRPKKAEAQTAEKKKPSKDVATLTPTREKSATSSQPTRAASKRASKSEAKRSAEVSNEKVVTGDTPDPKKDKKGYSYTMTGIDNLALLMENQSYSTSCFSMYLFKTEIDNDTVYSFFQSLAGNYPKYRYVVELSPTVASRREKERKRAEKQGVELPRREPTEEERRGRRTRYTKSLKAGGWFRPARWRLDPHFDLKENIEILDECPGGGDDDALFEVAGTFLARHFDFSKPIWEALVVRGLNTCEGARSALMVKVHHCFSDGQGMIMSYHSALAAWQTGKPLASVQGLSDRKTQSGEVKKPGQRNIQPTLWGTTKHVFHTAFGLYTRPRKSFTYKAASGSATSRRPRVPERFYYHSEGIPMEDIKLVRRAFSEADKGFNLSLNDVACAILSRALRIAAERTEKVRIKDRKTAIFVPISVRPRGNWDLANFTTGAIAWFSFHDPKERSFEEQLRQVNREMNRIKRSHFPQLAFWFTDLVCRRRAWFLPNYPGFSSFWQRTYREYHVATNVPGPPKPVRFGEHEAFRYHVLPPSSPGKSSLAIGMISYADDFSLAVSCDGVDEFRENGLAREICRAFQDGAAEIVAAARAKLAAADADADADKKAGDDAQEPSR